MSEVCNSSFPDSAKFTDHTIGFVGTNSFERSYIGTFDGQDPTVLHHTVHLPLHSSFFLQQSIGSLSHYLQGFTPPMEDFVSHQKLGRSRGRSKIWRLMEGDSCRSLFPNFADLDILGHIIRPGCRVPKGQNCPPLFFLGGDSDFAGLLGGQDPNPIDSFCEGNPPKMSWWAG